MNHGQLQQVSCHNQLIYTVQVQKLKGPGNRHLYPEIVGDRRPSQGIGGQLRRYLEMCGKARYSYICGLM